MHLLGESQDLQFVSRVLEKHQVVTVYAYAAATFPLMNKIIHDINHVEDDVRDTDHEMSRITTRFVLYAISMTPEEKLYERWLSSVSRLWSIQKTRRLWKPLFIPLKIGTKKTIDFSTVVM